MNNSVTDLEAQEAIAMVEWLRGTVWVDSRVDAVQSVIRRLNDERHPLGRVARRRELHGDPVNDELEFLTRDYPDMAEVAAFALAWARHRDDPIERVLQAVRNGRIPTRCTCDWEGCPGWVMLAPSEFGDILRAASDS